MKKITGILISMDIIWYDIKGYIDNVSYDRRPITAECVK